MSYTPYQKYDWQVGDEISESKLDHIEGGLEDASNQIPLKADAVGEHSDLGAGYAAAIEPTQYTVDEQPYLFRKALGARLTSEKIVGGTVAWNQLVGANDSTVTVLSGHKYFARIDGTASIGESDGTAMSVTGGVDMVTDLTLALGTTIANYIYALEQATAGAGIAFLRNNGFMTKDYYAYNAGELMSVLTSGHRTVGLNQWDGESELGYIDLNTGEPATGTTTSRTKNFVPVLPSTVYCYTNPNFTGIRIAFYNANKEFIGNLQNNNTTPQTFTTPATARYLKFYSSDVSKICINLSSDRNGEYEPYEEHLYPLSPVSLRGIMTLENGKLKNDGDTYEPSGTVTRWYGIVDLGTLNWYAQEGGTHGFFQTSDLEVKPPSSSSVAISNIILSNDKYSLASASVVVAGETDKVIGVRNNKRLAIADFSYTDAAAFKTAMSGVMLVYPLATPTTEEADPYQSEQTCSEYGTESFIDTRDVPIPVGHVTDYWPDLVEKIELLTDALSIVDGAINITFVKEI